LLAVVRLIAWAVLVSYGLMSTRAANKNVWLTYPEDTSESAQSISVCAGDSWEFHAKTSWPPGESWTWSSGVNIFGGTYPESYGTKSFPMPGLYQVWARYHGETANAINVTALDITQSPSQLWWFNGEDSSHYPEQVTLTAQGTSSGAFRWVVVSGANKVQLSDGFNVGDDLTIVNNPTVQVISTWASINPDDVSILLIHNDWGTCTHCLTVYTVGPPDLVVGPEDWNYFDGYKTTYGFALKDIFGNPLVNGVELNESFGPEESDYPLENWLWPGVSTDAPGDAMTDTYAAWDCSGPPPKNPCPVSTTDPNAGTPVDHAVQFYRAGSLTLGRGVLFKYHTLQRYRGKARQL
jgi:hypothetical protein